MYRFRTAGTAMPFFVFSLTITEGLLLSSLFDHIKYYKTNFQNKKFILNTLLSFICIFLIGYRNYLDFAHGGHSHSLTDTSTTPAQPRCFPVLTPPMSPGRLDPTFPRYQTPSGHPIRMARSIQRKTASVSVNHTRFLATTLQSCP